MLFRRRRFVRTVRQRQACDEDIVRVQSKIDFLQGDKRSHKQAGADQQNDRQRDLYDNLRKQLTLFHESGEAAPDIPTDSCSTIACDFRCQLRFRVEGFGVRVLKTPVHAPKAKAHCERLVGTIRRECLQTLRASCQITAGSRRAASAYGLEKEAT